MSKSIDVKGLTLEYRAGSRKRLVPDIMRKGVSPQYASEVGGDFIFNRNARYVRSLDDISFSLRGGDRLGLVGTNGAGKSTLLMVLAGIYPPTKGTVNVAGNIDALFNINLGFRPEATGRRNIFLRGLLNGWTPEMIASKTDEIIDFSELGSFIDMPFKAYSQGMAARLAFSIATAIEPDILLLDEWIGAGDGHFQNKAMQRMKTLTDSAGIMVIASHNHQLLRQTCTMAMRLERGKIVALGSPDDVLQN